ncbi:MAG: hypothetical protein ACI9O4_001155 [Chitinophagales bacterium]
MSLEFIPMPEDNFQKNNPLHGVKLADMLKFLIDEHGLEEIGERFNIRAFMNNPGYKSALKFLRTTPWAREKMEDLYIKTLKSK